MTLQADNQYTVHFGIPTKARGTRQQSVKYQIAIHPLNWRCELNTIRNRLVQVQMTEVKINAFTNHPRSPSYLREASQRSTLCARPSLEAVHRTRLSQHLQWPHFHFQMIILKWKSSGISPIPHSYRVNSLTSLLRGTEAACSEELLYSCRSVAVPQDFGCHI